MVLNSEFMSSGTLRVELPNRFPWIGRRGVAVDVRQTRAGDEERASFLACSFQKLPEIGMEEACQRDPVRCERGWKLFMLMPRMLLNRPPRGGHKPGTIRCIREKPVSNAFRLSDKPSRVLRTSLSLSASARRRSRQTS